MSSNMTVQDLLNHQEILQMSFGITFHDMATDQRCEFIRVMVLALEDELHELLNEIHWKPWSKAEPFINREEFRGELVDALHFFLNLALAVGLTGEEIENAYINKASVNRKRQADGYANDNKCELCGRASDEPK